MHIYTLIQSFKYVKNVNKLLNIVIFYNNKILVFTVQIILNSVNILAIINYIKTKKIGNLDNF